ncbi:hypothetical protein ACFLIM_24475 [Nonomuraea sp. M3C6]|uniref:Nucleotidyl transferase AbiEii toxin, Type IV TA system n=1 Tax=Nonomuraea marmarensis TaxID=3351344 RepID=A0ABW7AGB9_9ACTN
MLEERSWALIGGQMVALHGLAMGKPPIRFSSDLDVIANLALSPSSLTTCAAHIRSLGFTPAPTADGKRLHRFIHDNLVIDIVAPDHPPRRLLPLRIAGKDAIEIDGGWRALQSTGVMPVMFDYRQGQVPMPDLGGALVIKARAALADSRDPQRHLLDLAFLLSLVDNPRRLRERFTARDRTHLRCLALDGDTRQLPWIMLRDGTDRSNAAEAYLSLTRH